MKRFFHSLAFKISFSILLIETIVLLALGYYYVNRFSQEIDQRILSQAHIPGKLMAQQALNYDVVRDVNALDKLTGLKVINTLVVRRSDGMVFFAKDMENEDQSITDVVDAGAAKAILNAESTVLAFRVENEFESSLSVITPLFNKDNLIGHFYLKADTSIAAKKKYDILILFIISSALCILFTTLAEALVVHILTAPRIRRTIDCLKKVATGHLNESPLLVGSPDDIGVLQHSVNSMIAQLRQRTEEGQRAQREVIRHRDHLEEQVAARTASLEDANKEMEAFSYSISHDLRAPLRVIDGFSQAVLEDYKNSLDEAGQKYLNRIRSNTIKMSGLIDDLLGLSRVSRREINRCPVNLSELADEITQELQQQANGRAIHVKIADGIVAEGDPNLLRIALENLLGNACKFTQNSDPARISFGSESRDGNQSYFVQDNGVGFNMRFAHKLFGPFQRLHSDKEFEGTGIGLATVQRIIQRHGGKVWAQSEPGQGAIFYFRLS